MLHRMRLRRIGDLSVRLDLLAFMNLNKKSCRNCGSTELFSRDVNAKGGYGPDLLPLGFFSAVKFHIRVCADCGFVDWFVPPEQLSKVRKKFTREG